MTLLVIAAVALGYLCIVVLVMSLLVSAKRADTAVESDRRRRGRWQATWDDRHVAEEEEPPAEISVRRRAG